LNPPFGVMTCFFLCIISHLLAGRKEHGKIRMWEWPAVQKILYSRYKAIIHCSCAQSKLQCIVENVIEWATHPTTMVCTDEHSAYKRTRKVMNWLLEMVELLRIKRQFWSLSASVTKIWVARKWQKSEEGI
jgi:hypothetical protein